MLVKSILFDKLRTDGRPLWTEGSARLWLKRHGYVYISGPGNPNNHRDTTHHHRFRQINYNDMMFTSPPRFISKKLNNGITFVCVVQRVMAEERRFPPSYTK